MHAELLSRRCFDLLRMPCMRCTHTQSFMCPACFIGESQRKTWWQCAWWCACTPCVYACAHACALGRCITNHWHNPWHMSSRCLCMHAHIIYSAVVPAWSLTLPYYVTHTACTLGTPTAAALTRVGQADDSSPLVLSLRYEPPSPKFSRAHPSLVSYR